MSTFIIISISILFVGILLYGIKAISEIEVI
jgi:hypothetical protein